MIKLSSPQQLQRMRRLALSTQGLLTVQPFGRGLPGVRRAIEHLGYVQLDTISVVERAHHHVLFSRVSGFKPEMVDKLMQHRDIFEYWSHAAAVLPIKDFRYSLPYKHAIKSGQIHWYKNPDEKLMREILARIKSEGPLRSRDLESQTKNKPKNKANNPGWWDWKPAKKAIEQLYMQGDLMITKREGFQKTYDLTKRVLPSDTNTEMPTADEWTAYLLDQQLRCHGVVSPKGLTYLRRNKALKQSMNTLLNEHLSQGALEQVQLPQGQIYLIESGMLEQAMSRASNRVQIISPFDNAVIQRDRLKDIYGFEYQIECYVPAAKRQFGYFCLPLLYRDQFIGLMDCKAHRNERQLEIKSLHVHSTDVNDAFFDAFLSALKAFSDFQCCDEVVLNEVWPKNMQSIFRKLILND